VRVSDTRTDTRPDNEKWELIDGEPILNASPSRLHLPEPDIFIVPAGSTRGDPYGRETNNVPVALEILSPSAADRDLRWKRTAYTSLPSLTHYVVIAQDAVDIVVFAREAGFAERRLRSLADSLELPALGISLPLKEIYRDTGLR
jgi:Uma2 family endonuclease